MLAFLVSDCTPSFLIVKLLSFTVRKYRFAFCPTYQGWYFVFQEEKKVCFWVWFLLVEIVCDTSHEFRNGKQIAEQLGSMSRVWIEY